MHQSRLSNWPLYAKLQIYGFLIGVGGLITGFGGEYVGSLAMRWVGFVLVAAGVLAGSAGVIWAIFTEIPRSIRRAVAEPPWRDLGRVDSRTGRPRIITLICWFGFAVAGGRALLALLAAVDPSLRAPQADGTPGAGDAFVFGTAIALLGYWRMRRWGVWLLGAVVAAETFVLALTGSPLRDWGNLSGAVVFLVIGVRYYGRMA